MNNKQAGFTLIELSIVLVIIGLLLAGVLKGQELINSAKAKNMAADLKNVQLYLYGYQDRFHALPGDDNTVTAHLGATASAATTGGTVGNGDIEGGWNSTVSTAESFLFWQHVRLAGFAGGSSDITAPATYLPTNTEGGRIGVQSTPSNAITNLAGTFVVCSDRISGRLAQQIDSSMDDGAPNSGTIMAVAQTSGASAVTGTTGVAAATGWNNGNKYTVCLGF